MTKTKYTRLNRQYYYFQATKIYSIRGTKNLLCLKFCNYVLACIWTFIICFLSFNAASSVATIVLAGAVYQRPQGALGTRPAKLLLNFQICLPSFRYLFLASLRYTILSTGNNARKETTVEYKN